jgi:hypothetical protein
MVDFSEVESKAVATAPLSDVLCVRLHCRAEVSHLTTDHLFGALKKRLGCRQFTKIGGERNVFRVWLPIKEPNFYRGGIFKLLTRREDESSGTVSRM